MTPAGLPSERFATSKWLVEPVVVVVDLAVTTPRQTTPSVLLQRACVTESSGPCCVWPGVVSIGRRSIPATAAIVMLPW